MPGLLRSSLGVWVDPAECFVALCGDETDVVWLDSGPHAAEGRSYIGRAARVVTSGTIGSETGFSVTDSSVLDSSVLEFLRRELAANRIAAAGEGFALGWGRLIGYETRFETMGRRARARRAARRLRLRLSRSRGRVRPRDPRGDHCWPLATPGRASSPSGAPRWPGPRCVRVPECVRGLSR
ncbi:MAG: hypothetical protein WDM88_13690 [Galbitalea sp.]